MIEKFQFSLDLVSASLLDLQTAEEVVTVTTGDSNEQVNDDLRRKEDVLRARDIVPPYNKETPPAQDSPRKVPPARGVRADSPATKEHGVEIPKFDLAEQILAEQRKITAVKRKAPDKGIRGQAPGKKVEPVTTQTEPESAIHFSMQPSQTLSEQDQIIADIVARDIRRLCGRSE